MSNLLKLFDDLENTVKPYKRKINMQDNQELRWTHEGDSLVSVMLLEGFKYIMCEIGEEDKQYFKNKTPRFIIESQDDGGFFIDTKGNMWQSVQAINNDGTVMSYDDYLMLKQLKEVKCGK